VSLKKAVALDTFRTEWALKLHSIEESLGFLHLQLSWALQELETPSEHREDNLVFCKTETPLVMQDAREALRLLRFLSDPESHCDQ